jgi:hypothetical protein
MKTLVCDRPGGLSLIDRLEPVRKADEVLIRIRRIGVCGIDFHIFQGRQPYLRYPRVMGHELVGEIMEAPEAKPVAARSGGLRGALPLLRPLPRLPQGTDQLLPHHQRPGRAPGWRHGVVPDGPEKQRGRRKRHRPRCGGDGRVPQCARYRSGHPAGPSGFRPGYRALLAEVPDQFARWLTSEAGVIKAIIEI